FFFQAEDGIRSRNVTGVQTCALPIYPCGGTMQILVCDDEPLARARLVRWLEELDDIEQVHEAANGAEALAACQQHAMDLVLMDRSEERRVGKESRGRWSQGWQTSAAK